MSKIYISITHKDSKDFKIKTNARIARVGDLIGDFLHRYSIVQKEKGPTVDQDVYHIDLSIDLSNNTWTASCDTGDSGVRGGILMEILESLTGREGVFDWLQNRPISDVSKCKQNISSSPLFELASSSLLSGQPS